MTGCGLLWIAKRNLRLSRLIRSGRHRPQMPARAFDNRGPLCQAIGGPRCCASQKGLATRIPLICMSACKGAQPTRGPVLLRLLSDEVVPAVTRRG